MSPTLGNGIHVSLSREDYDRSPRANWSKLKILARSPAHYRHAQMAEHVDSDAMKFGRCAHLATLEPERFLAECAVWDGGRRAGKEWEAFKTQHAGLELLKEDEYQRCLSLQSAVRSHPVAGQYLRGGKSEVSVYWTYSAPQLGGIDGFSLDCKSRLDFVGDGALVDLKTTRDASPEGFGRQAWNLKYHVQAAFYSDAYEQATGRRPPYVIVAVENIEPYVVQVYTVPERLLDLGREEYRDLLSRLDLCRASANWPGYADGMLELEPPRWAVPTTDEDATGLDLDMGLEAAQ